MGEGERTEERGNTLELDNNDNRINDPSWTSWVSYDQDRSLLLASGSVCILMQIIITQTPHVQLGPRLEIEKVHFPRRLLLLSLVVLLRVSTVATPPEYSNRRKLSYFLDPIQCERDHGFSSI